jgi:hypothetical protein
VTDVRCGMGDPKRKKSWRRRDGLDPNRRVIALEPTQSLPEFRLLPLNRAWATAHCRRKSGTLSASDRVFRSDSERKIMGRFALSRHVAAYATAQRLETARAVATL